MKIVIDNAVYTDLKNLSFAPQVDLIGNALPINEFTVDLLAASNPYGNGVAELRDEEDNLWAGFMIDVCEQVDAQTWHIRARDNVAILDAITLQEVVYSGVTLEGVLDSTMLLNAGEETGIEIPMAYDLDAALSSVTITGYFPEQSARERLQWVCFVAGAYVQTCFVDLITVKKLDDTPTLIPPDKTFWRPQIGHGEYVTAIKLTAYTFTQDADAAADAGSYTFPLPWVATTQVMRLDNPDAQGRVVDNVMEIDELYAANPGNASALMARLADRYFTRTEITADVLDNREYLPGDRVYLFDRDGNCWQGYIEAASFRFGKQARATLKVVAAGTVETAGLTVSYTYSGATLATETYRIPVNYPYSIETRYLDIEAEGHRTVYRPTVPAVSGTMTSSGASAAVPCEITLDFEGGVLSIYAVDEAQVGSDLFTMVIS